MTIWSGLKSIFGFEGVGNTALKIVDRMAGTDWTPEQKAEFILKHAEVAKHQSPMRRFIAGSYTIAWLMLVATWMASAICGRMFNSENAILLSGDIINFMSSNVNIAMNGILAFYFLMNMRK
jgi:hypothetical protein